MTENAFKRIRNYDRARPNISGEHWLAPGGRRAMLLDTRHHPAFLVRLLGSVAGSALVIRAVNGSEVPRPMTRLLPFRRDGKRRYARLPRFKASVAHAAGCRLAAGRGDLVVTVALGCTLDTPLPSKEVTFVEGVTAFAVPVLGQFGERTGDLSALRDVRGIRGDVVGSS